MATILMDHKKLLINNEWRDAVRREDDGRHQSRDRGGRRRSVASAERSDVDAAVNAARAAFAGPWGEDVGARARPADLPSSRDRLMERADEVARLETLHNGKPIFESRQIEIPAAAECFEYYAGWADKVMGETIPVKGQLLHLHAARAARRRRARSCRGTFRCCSRPGRSRRRSRAATRSS